jgi:hypothetical protein
MEIDSYNAKIQMLMEFENLDISGESVSAIKRKNKELIEIIRMLIDADQCDVRDLSILSDRVRGIYINGDEVLRNIETARRNADECSNTASSLSAAADRAIYPWEAQSLRGMASASRSQADSWNRIREHWEKQRDLYDAIDDNTSQLFRDGTSLNRQAGIKMNSRTQWGLSRGQYDANGSSDLLRSGAGKISIVDFTKRYLASSGFDESDIDIIYKNYYDVFLLIMQAQRHHSFELYDLLIKARKLCLKESYRSIYDDLVDHQGYTSEQAMDFLYDLYANDALESYDKSLYFPVSDPFTDIKDDLEFERYIFEKINFPIRPEEIEQVHDILVDFGITDRYSIACFLLCCDYETYVPNPNSIGEGDYCDSNGLLISELYDEDSDYEYSVRGVGYIQVTHLDNQRRAYEELYARGYVGELDADGSYVNELAQSPWAVSAWYWSMNPTLEDGSSLNEYVVNVINSEEYKGFTIGLPYVCEAFVNGKETREIDDYHHLIARGMVDNWTVDSYGYLWINNTNTQLPSILRFNEMANSFRLIMEDKRVCD